MNIHSVHFINISLDNVNFDKNDFKTIIHVTCMTFHNRFKQRKSFENKIIKELMLVAWHPKKWWDCSVLRDKKSEIENFKNIRNL